MLAQTALVKKKLFKKLSTNIQIIIYAAIVCAPLSVIILIISCCLKSTKGRRYLFELSPRLCGEEQEVTPLETPMQGFGLFTKTRRWTRSSTYSTTIDSPASSPTTTTAHHQQPIQQVQQQPIQQQQQPIQQVQQPIQQQPIQQQPMQTTTTKETSPNKETKPKTLLLSKTETLVNRTERVIEEAAFSSRQWGRRGGTVSRGISGDV
ncbi:unnamed protein product [Mytilus coruscus]|uniref:Uncharacterized protein n=1 Tax=Mytilus coruscus TaxID=42192 RepID=A0A6J7ZZ56_MYTCO|nr:unnamed protein product [Mytilus coruscus]